jgi:Flp pilus assembly protein TadG
MRCGFALETMSSYTPGPITLIDKPAERNSMRAINSIVGLARFGTLVRNPVAGVPERAKLRLLGRRSGQSFVELALLLPILIPLLAGSVDLGRAFYYDVLISNAANVGVQAVANGAPDADVRTAVNNTLPSSVTAQFQSGDVTITPIASNRTAGFDPSTTCTAATGGCYRWATVGITYRFTLITPAIEHLIPPPAGSPPGTIVLTRKASQRMRIPCSLSTGSPCT